MHHHNPHHSLHSLKLSPTTSAVLHQQRERERDREREREQRMQDLPNPPPPMSPNGTEGSMGAHDLLMDSPSE